MRVDMEKNVNKDVFRIIKTAISYPPKLARSKTSYANFCKLTQITKKRRKSIAIEMTENSNGNNKFKEWREVKLIENENKNETNYCSFIHSATQAPPYFYVTDILKRS